MIASRRCAKLAPGARLGARPAAVRVRAAVSHAFARAQHGLVELRIEPAHPSRDPAHSGPLLRARPRIRAPATLLHRQLETPARAGSVGRGPQEMAVVIRRVEGEGRRRRSGTYLPSTPGLSRGVAGCRAAGCVRSVARHGGVGGGAVRRAALVHGPPRDARRDRARRGPHRDAAAQPLRPGARGPGGRRARLRGEAHHDEPGRPRRPALARQGARARGDRGP